MGIGGEARARGSGGEDCGAFGGGETTLGAAGVAFTAPQALRTSVAMVRTKVRKRMFFMICLS